MKKSIFLILSIVLLLCSCNTTKKISGKTDYGKDSSSVSGHTNIETQTITIYDTTKTTIFITETETITIYDTTKVNADGGYNIYSQTQRERRSGYVNENGIGIQEESEKTEKDTTAVVTKETYSDEYSVEKTTKTKMWWLLPLIVFVVMLVGWITDKKYNWTYIVLKYLHLK